MRKSLNKKNVVIALLSFLIPVIISALSYYKVQIYPGGINTIIIYDMKAQLLPAYSFIAEGGRGYDTFFYNMSGGLGGGFFAKIVNIASVFDLVYSFVSVENLPDAIYFLTVFKIGLCGLFMSIFLLSKRTNHIAVVLLSCCYALMSYNFMYAMWPLWLDMVMLLPIQSLSLEKIISGKKSTGFILLLSIGIISCYYITFTSVIALSMYFFFRLIEEKTILRDILKRSLSYALHGFISAGLSAIIIFPVIYDLVTGKLSVSGDVSSHSLINNSVFDVLNSFRPLIYNGLGSTTTPNIFCGSIVFILTVIWFAAGKGNVKTRIAGVIILLIYICSFVFAPLDRMWHGFREPSSFAARYAYTFVFFMICFAERGVHYLTLSDLKISKTTKRCLVSFAIIYSFCELFFNGSYILVMLSIDTGYSNRNEYLRYLKSMKETLSMIDDDSEASYCRVFKDFHYSYSDGMLFGYDGLLDCDSSLNPKYVDFLSGIGIATTQRSFNEIGITPPVASLLDFGYFVSKSPENYYFNLIGEHDYIYVYRNEYNLPLIFESGIGDGYAYKEFSNDPFDNVNIFVSDLSGTSDEDSTVFVRQNVTADARDEQDYCFADTVDSIDYNVIPDQTGGIWLYSEYKDLAADFFDGEKNEDGYLVKKTYADYYLNGEKIGSFRTDKYSYINFIDIMEAQNNYTVTLDTSYSEIGDTFFYRYDEDAFDNAFSVLYENKFNIEYIGTKGIKAVGTVDDEGYIFISLPYEAGYSIYIDGDKTDYISYRDAFILVKAEAGDHFIEIKYLLPGLIPGIICSAVFILVLCAFSKFGVVFFEKRTVKP